MIPTTMMDIICSKVTKCKVSISLVLRMMVVMMMLNVIKLNMCWRIVRKLYIV